MKSQIIDFNALKSISPAALKAYIEGDGWRAVEKFGSHSQVFARESFKSELIVPGTSNLADYPNIVADILAHLSSAEGRDQQQIYRDLSTADKDVVRVRTPEADDTGSVSLEIGVDLVVYARDLLLSAACSAWKAQPVYRAGKVAKADEYMERVRLGQTEQGSFIVTLLAPVPPALQHLMLPEPIDEQPFERKVTRRLSQGLDAAAQAVEKYNLNGSASEFEKAVNEGLSANLCEAIAKLSNDGNGVDVSITWAKTRPDIRPRWSRKFSRSEGEILGEVARQFKLKQPRPDERIEGIIVDLHRDQHEEVGRVTLHTSVDGKATAIKFDLPKDVYEEAIRLHRDKTTLSIEGDLERDGQRWKLVRPRNMVEVLPDSNSSDS